jgi:hypothetical protein
MGNGQNSLKPILVVIAALLAANLVFSLWRADRPTAATIVPSVQAGEVLRQQGDMLFTTNEAGDTLYVWQFGRFVGDGYESIDARVYRAAGTTRY